MPRSSSINPFASIIGGNSSENDNNNSRYSAGQGAPTKQNKSAVPTKNELDRAGKGLQERRETTESKEDTLMQVKIEEKSSGDDLMAVASKLAGMSDLSTESILAFISGTTTSTKSSSNTNATTTTSMAATTVTSSSTSEEMLLSPAPKSDRYSVGVRLGKNRSRLSTAGRESLDMRDFDLDEVKRHRLSLLSQSPAPPTADSLPTPRDQESKERVNLLEYCAVGVDREVLAGKIHPDWMSCRQRATVLDCYPTPSPLIENINDYCFPRGVPLDLLSQSEVAAYSQTHRDRLHVLSFQDAKGTPTYATVLTVVEVVPTSFTLPVSEVLAGDINSTSWAQKENSNLVAYLLMLEKRKKAAGVILRFFARRSKSLPKNIFEEAVKPKSRLGEVVQEAMTAEKERRQGQDWVRSPPPPLYNQAASIYNGVTLVKKTEKKASHTPSKPGEQDQSMMARFAAWSSAKGSVFGVYPSSTADKTTAPTNDNSSSISTSTTSGDTKREMSHTRTFDNVSGLYEFFSDEESSVTDESSFLSSPRSRTRTGSSIQSVESLSKIQGEESQYFIATETAYCMLHERSHHSVAAKMLIAIANKESLTSPLDGQSLGEASQLDLKDRMVATARFLARSGALKGDETACSTATTKGEETLLAVPLSMPVSERLERDRAISTLQVPPTSRFTKDNLLLCDVLYLARAKRREGFVSYMQTYPLVQEQRLPPQAQEQEQEHKLSYPAYSSRGFRLPALFDSHVHLSLKNPEMVHPMSTSHIYRDEEWVQATLFATLPAEVIVQVTKILLMERSVVIYCSDTGLVTAITTAFKSLLSPFTWAGAFVPLLPMNCKEIMQAPVPFLVGTTSHPNTRLDVSPHASVLHVDDYLQLGERERGGTAT